MLSRHLDSAASGQTQIKLALTRVEAARALSISPATLDRLVQRGLLRPSRATRRPLFSVSELQWFLAETTSSLDQTMQRHKQLVPVQRLVDGIPAELRSASSDRRHASRRPLRRNPATIKIYEFPI